MALTDEQVKLIEKSIFKEHTDWKVYILEGKSIHSTKKDKMEAVKEIVEQFKGYKGEYVILCDKDMNKIGELKAKWKNRRD